MGVLTAYLLEKPVTTYAIEIDSESIAYLQAHFLELSNRIIKADVLKYDFSKTFGKDSFAIIGNFPYNISTQIVFKMLENMTRHVQALFGLLLKE
jgi:16S rRNA (adenine1518-N6/adenine1519-N6)-dimethyltransferase